MSDSQLAALLFVQLMCILAVCRTLMNARGMVELILASLGLPRRLITLAMLTMLVIMARGTTIMTGPLFSLRWEREGEPAVDAALTAEYARPA